MAFVFESHDGVPCTTFFGVVTGTHSAGKSTLINSFYDPDFNHNFDLDNVDPYNLIPRLGGMMIDYEDLVVPIIVGEEASTFYVRHTGRPEHVTDGYTFEHQIRMEHFAASILSDTRTKAMGIAETLQTDAKSRKAVVLTDRSMLDGYVYSSLRTPESDQEMLDHSAIDIATIGFTSGTIPGLLTPSRQWDREFMRNYCDFVIVPDNNEVIFEYNGKRQTSLEFRDLVDSAIKDYYTSVLGEDKIHYINGTHQQRREAALAIIESALDITPIVY